MLKIAGVRTNPRARNSHVNAGTHVLRPSSAASQGICRKLDCEKLAGTLINPMIQDVECLNHRLNPLHHHTCASFPVAEKVTFFLLL